MCVTQANPTWGSRSFDPCLGLVTNGASAASKRQNSFATRCMLLIVDGCELTQWLCFGRWKVACKGRYWEDNRGNNPENSIFTLDIT